MKKDNQLSLMLKKMMEAVMLSCETATLFTAKKEFGELSVFNSFRLRLHLMACKYCKLFDEESKIITKGIKEFDQNINGGSPTRRLSKESRQRMAEEIQSEIS